MFVFLDLDGTLLDQDAAQTEGARRFHREYRELFTQDEETFLTLWRALTDEHVAEYLAGRITHDEQRRRRMRDLFATVGRDLNDKEVDAVFSVYLRAFEAAWRAYADVTACLDELETRGIPLGIISNGDGEQQRQKLDAIGMNGRFDPVVIAGDLGIFKPDRRIVEAACHAASREPGECVYVGDALETDARAAAAAGMQSVCLEQLAESISIATGKGGS